MFRLDLICFTNSGISAARTVSVRPMIDSTQMPPLSGSMPSSSNIQCHATSTAEIT